MYCILSIQFISLMTSASAEDIYDIPLTSASGFKPAAFQLQHGTCSLLEQLFTRVLLHLKTQLLVSLCCC